MGNLLGEWHQGVAFRAGIAPPRSLADKKDDESEDQAKTDREREGNDGHVEEA